MPNQSLRIHSPTQSTTSYTVTTRKIPRSHFARIVSRLLTFLRFALTAACFGLLALVIADYLSLSFSRGTQDGTAVEQLEASENQAWANWAGMREDVETGVYTAGLESLGGDAWRVRALAVVLGWVRHLEKIASEQLGTRLAISAIVGALGAVLWMLIRRGYVEESILAMRSLGVQTSTSSSSIFLSPTTRFIPTAQIQDIFIYEAFIGFSVRFYLAIIVEGEEQAVVVFPKLLPRRETVEEVWRGVRRVLWDTSKSGGKSGPGTEVKFEDSNVPGRMTDKG